MFISIPRTKKKNHTILGAVTKRGPTSEAEKCVKKLFKIFPFLEDFKGAIFNNFFTPSLFSHNVP